MFGPGSRYQIDATIGDVYLVSEVNRNWIIGRPVIYLVMDVFSRMVVGMYVGLEGPSWAGAMMALTNVVADKKEYCPEYDIEINERDWPCCHLPEISLADKGEFEGYNVERLVRAFNLHVENAASYRADWKGIVEKQFDLIQKKVKPLRVVSALDACKKFGYYLHANKELMHQLAFEFLVEGKTYYLPQNEFVRAVFAINKSMSNAMIRPNGLELLVNRVELNDNTASIDLVNEIPNGIARDKDFIRYFVWLYFNIDLKKYFESIYTNLYEKLSNQQELKLEVNLPAPPDVFIRFRGIEKDNNYLILEWLGTDMAETLFTDIEVKHLKSK